MKVQHRLLSPLSPFPQTGSLNVELNITDIQHQHSGRFRVTDRSCLALCELRDRTDSHQSLSYSFVSII